MLVTIKSPTVLEPRLCLFHVWQEERIFGKTQRSFVIGQTSKGTTKPIGLPGPWTCQKMKCSYPVLPGRVQKEALCVVKTNYPACSLEEGLGPKYKLI